MKRALHEASYAARRLLLLRQARKRNIEIPDDWTIDEIQTRLDQADEVQRSERK